MDIYFAYLFIDGHFGSFHVLAIMNNTTIYMSVQISLWYLVFGLFGIYPDVEMLGHIIILFLISLRSYPTGLHNGCNSLHKGYTCTAAAHSFTFTLCTKSVQGL